MLRHQVCMFSIPRLTFGLEHVIGSCIALSTPDKLRVVFLGSYGPPSYINLIIINGRVFSALFVFVRRRWHVSVYSLIPLYNAH